MWYQFALRNDLQTVAKPEIVHASVLDGKDNSEVERTDGGGCSVETDQQQDLDLEFDFGLELLADPDDFDSISVASCIDCVSMYIVEISTSS